MQASLFLVVTLMPAPLPAINSHVQSIWRAHHMAVVPPTISHMVFFQELASLKFWICLGYVGNCDT